MPEDRPGRLKRRAEFKAAAAGRKVGGRLFTLQVRPRTGADGPPRIGFTVTRREGGAVERNRMRRRLRVAADTVIARDGRAGHDYVIVARRPVLEASFPSLLAELAGAVRRAHSDSKPAPAPRGRQTEDGDG